jgi:hypothetical protein
MKITVVPHYGSTIAHIDLCQLDVMHSTIPGTTSFSIPKNSGQTGPRKSATVQAIHLDLRWIIAEGDDPKLSICGRTLEFCTTRGISRVQLGSFALEFFHDPEVARFRNGGSEYLSKYQLPAVISVKTMSDFSVRWGS